MAHLAWAENGRPGICAYQAFTRNEEIAMARNRREVRYFLAIHEKRCANQRFETNMEQTPIRAFKKTPVHQQEDKTPTPPINTEILYSFGCQIDRSSS